MDELQKKYNLLVAQNEILQKENTELRSLLCAHGIEYKPRPSPFLLGILINTGGKEMEDTMLSTLVSLWVSIER